jgi:hypothetical protein
MVSLEHLLPLLDDLVCEAMKDLEALFLIDRLFAEREEEIVPQGRVHL